MFQTTQQGTIIDLSPIGAAIQPSHQVDTLVVLTGDVSHILLDFFVANSRHIVLCDGAANHFYRSKHRKAANIRAIVGDLDSIEEEVRAYYSEHIEIRDLSADQDTNDFQKGLAMAIELGSKRIVSVGLLGGRFDQEMNNLSVLQKYAQKYKETDFMAAGKDCLICVIKPNVRTTVRQGKHFAKRHAGLTCFGKARVETKGFKWELGQGGPEELEWGKLVSSSNVIMEGEVTIMASNMVFLSLDLDDVPKKGENEVIQLL